MSIKFRIAPMQDNSLLYVYSIRDSIQIDPTYQRMSDIWPLEKQQYFIDSIVNGFDIPKLYFHEFIPLQVVKKKTYRYAIIDGKQRLEAIWRFLENKFALPDRFEFIEDKSVDLSGMTYSEIADKYPLIKIRFDGKPLPITTVQTDDTEFIEDMFSRLNEAVPLSAPEKRNAFGGPLPNIIRKLSRTDFFTEKLPFTNSRYRHLDLATKFLYFELIDDFTDTKKKYLDDFVKNFKDQLELRQRDFQHPETEAKILLKKSQKVLSRMTKIFISKDPLLSSMGTVVLYYFLFRFEADKPWFGKLTRGTLMKFDEVREENRKLAEEDGDAKFEFLEYDRMAQGPNDKSYMQYRYKVLRDYLQDELGK